MIVLVILLTIGKFARNARRPNNQELFLLVVEEELWRPHVDSVGVGHNLNEALLLPVYEVFRRRVAKTAVATPTAGPHEVKRSVGAHCDARVAHDFLFAYFGRQKGALNGIPSQTVGAIDEA